MEAAADQLAAAGKLVVQLHRHEILLLWNDGEPIALSNICIHRGRELNEGVMLGTRLVCAGHQWAYEVTTGYCKARERYQPRYPLAACASPSSAGASTPNGPRWSGPAHGAGQKRRVERWPGPEVLFGPWTASPSSA